jgi:hypothetical protein
VKSGIKSGGLTPNRWVVTVHELKAGGQRTTTAGSVHIASEGKRPKTLPYEFPKKIATTMPSSSKNFSYFHQ